MTKGVLHVLVAVMLLVGMAPIAPTKAQALEPEDLVQLFSEHLEYYLPFDGSSASATQAITSAHGVTYEQGKFGQAARFDAQDDYVKLVGRTKYPSDYSFTVALWIKDSGTGDPAIFANKSWVSGDNLGFVFSTREGDVKFNVNAGEVGRSDYNTTKTLRDNAWHHFVGTVNRQAGTVNMYVDGTLLGTGDISQYAGLSFTALSTMIGNDGTGAYPDGTNNALIDDFCMFDTALDAESVEALYGASGTLPRLYYADTVINVNGGTTVTPSLVKDDGGMAGTWAPVQYSSTDASLFTVDPATGAITANSEGATGSAYLVASSIWNGVLALTAQIEVKVSSANPEHSILFGVTADNHIYSATNTGKAFLNDRLAKAYQFFNGIGTDVDVAVGDIVDSGPQANWDNWKAITDANKNPATPLLTALGNHEAYDEQDQETYVDKAADQMLAAAGHQPNEDNVIGGYHFITISPGSGALTDTSSGGVVSARGTTSAGYDYAYIVDWLKERLAAAAAEDPTKPVFVFMHLPLADTYFNTDISSEQARGISKAVFSPYPQAVVFSGHIHLPNSAPHVIWQDGGFTAVNVPTTYYMYMQDNVVSGALPPNAEDISQAMTVEVQGSSVTIRNYDLLANQYIPQTWTFDVSKPAEFPYTSARNALAQPPVFPADATVSVSDITGDHATLEFDQAVVVDPNNLGDTVIEYRYDFIDKATGQVATSFKSWSDFYRQPRQATFTQEPSGILRGSSRWEVPQLKPLTEYEVHIYAINAFGKTSEGYLSATFTTSNPPNTVTFNTGEGGSFVAPASVEYGSILPQPATPARTGYTFGGWYKDSGCTQPWDFAVDTVQGSRTLYAKWTWTGGVVGGFGTPVIDGVEDGIWAASTPIHASSPGEPITADFKALWDEDYLYLYARIDDNTPALGNPAQVYPYDASESIDIWVNWTADEGVTTYNTDAASHYLFDRNGVVGVGATFPGTVTGTVVSDANGYIVEAALPLSPVVDPDTFSVMGLNCSINNDANNDGIRDSYITWAGSDETHYWSDPSHLPLLEMAQRPSADDPYLTLTGPTAATAGDTLDYTVSLGAVKDAGTIRVDVTPTGTLEFLEATSLDASGKLSVASTKKKADGTISVILTATELPGITFDGASPILKLSFKATAEGQGSVTLIKAEGASYIYNGSQFEGTADIEVALPEGADATITTAIAKYIDPYDFNRDDKVTLADLTYVQAFYMASADTGGSRWAHAVERGMDLDASGTIDVADLILIIDHLYEIEA